MHYAVFSQPCSSCALKSNYQYSPQDPVLKNNLHISIRHTNFQTYLEKSLETDSSFRRDPVGDFDEWRRALVVGHLSARDSIKGTLREGSFTGEPKRWGFWEICKMPCRQASLFIGALLGNLEGVHLLGLLRDKKSISGFLSWTQRTLRFQVWGPSGTLVGQGSPELISDYGVQRARL